jgi:organic hydroperoxide reductase OsmC/OhrA
MGLAAMEKKIVLPTGTAVDAEVDLGTGTGGYFLQARLTVSLPGLASDVAQSVIEYAHQNCPYSKMTRGNIDVSITLA